MSLNFNDITNFKGIIQLYEKELGFARGDISGNSNKLKELTADINLALDDFHTIAIPASGTWQFDDSGHTDFPIIRANLVDGQRDYTFTTDGSGNLILNIYRVFVLLSSTSTVYNEVYPVDQQSDIGTEGFWDGNNTEGAPFWYDKTANGFFLDPIPSYNATNGLKVYINREGSYFVSTDTTKKPGVPGIFHAWFYLKPALEYARRNNLAVERKLKERVLEMEEDIKKYFGKRSRDERTIMTPKKILYI